jgi:hypothetical protein
MMTTQVYQNIRNRTHYGQQQLALARRTTLLARCSKVYGVLN